MMRQLKRLEFYGRYGDYAAVQTNHMKTFAEDNQLKEKRKVQKYWTTINQNVKNEIALQERHKNGETIDLDQLSTLRAIDQVCGMAGPDIQTMHSAIDSYATRNRLFHNTVTEMLQAGKYQDLAEQIYKDLAALSKIDDASEPLKEIAVLKEVITEIKNIYFEVGEGHEDEPLEWQRTKAAAKARLKPAEEKEYKDAVSKKGELSATEFVKRSMILRRAFSDKRLKRSHSEFEEEELKAIRELHKKFQDLAGISTKVWDMEEAFKKKQKRFQDSLDKQHKDFEEELERDFAALDPMCDKRAQVKRTIRNFYMSSSEESEPTQLPPDDPPS